MTREADEALLRLDALLTDLAFHREAMSAGEIDGFVTGLVVYPEKGLRGKVAAACMGRGRAVQDRRAGRRGGRRGDGAP